MEKRKAHYDLTAIQAQMLDVGSLRLTTTARRTIIEMDFSYDDAVGAIQALTRADFYKSMTTHRNHKVWQDVYNSTFNGVDLYIKFQRDSEDGFFFTISFKEK